MGRHKRLLLNKRIEEFSRLLIINHRKVQTKMITRVSETDFTEEFKAIQGFTYHGLKALYADYEAYEDSTGEEFKLYEIDISSDFIQYDNWAEFENDFSSYVSDHSIKDLEDLKDHTTVIPISEEFTGMDINGIMSSNKEGFIIRSF